jgi:hypothetical protein
MNIALAAARFFQQVVGWSREMIRVVWPEKLGSARMLAFFLDRTGDPIRMPKGLETGELSQIPKGMSIKGFKISPDMEAVEGQ